MPETVASVAAGRAREGTGSHTGPVATHHLQDRRPPTDQAAKGERLDAAEGSQLAHALGEWRMRCEQGCNAVPRERVDDVQRRGRRIDRAGDGRWRV